MSLLHDFMILATHEILPDPIADSLLTDFSWYAILQAKLCVHAYMCDS